MDYFVAGRDQSAVDQPKNMLKVTPHSNYCNHYSEMQCHKQRCAFFPFLVVFFVGATSVVLQQQLL